MRIGVLWSFFFGKIGMSILTPFPSSLSLLVEEGPPLFSFLNQFKREHSGGLTMLNIVGTFHPGLACMNM